jgi:hypothetical protein
VARPQKINIMSGGACFTPRLNPRPAYPSALTVLQSTIVNKVRVPTLCCCVAYALHAPYLAFCTSMLAKVGC